MATTRRTLVDGWLSRVHQGFLAGIPGASVTASDRRYFVDGREMGFAKEYSKTGVIPKGHYFVSADHPDSLDSRYALKGWVADDQVLGQAMRLF